MNKEHESKDREKIMELVSQFYNKYHVDKKYNSGDRVAYAGRCFDENEMMALVDSALDFWLTAGRYADLFEEKMAEFLGVKFCYAVNSGSSANLLAFMALTSYLLKERAITRGDEVITVAAGFPTTIAPIVQFGAIPVFVDVTIPEYNIDVTQLENAISEKTKAVMLAHTLGNPFNIKAVKEFCDKHNLWLIEDNCDALGTMYECCGKSQFTGTFGDIGTSSFYPPHHMTMGEGGAVYTNNATLAKILKSMRDWGRDCVCPSGVDNICKHRFDKQYGELPFGYDHKYVYSHFGYNLKITEMQASIGVEQLKKLPKFIEKRKENFVKLYDGLKDLQDFFVLPKAQEFSSPSWFGFLLTCKEKGKRDKIVSYLEKHNIQTRNLFAGNILKHPCVTDDNFLKQNYRVVSNLDATNRIMNDTFWVGVSPKINDEMIAYMVKIFHEAVNNI